MAKPIHHVEPHPSGLPGVEALTLLSGHAFPRHSHDGYGIGVMTAGAQRSWSLVGEVEAETGDVLMTNPGEMHDGAPLGGDVRGWHILYLDPAVVAVEAALEGRGGDLTLRPVARDPRLAAAVARLFARLKEPRRPSDGLAVEEGAVSCLLLASQAHRIDGPRAPEPLSPPVHRALERLRDAPEAATSLAELAALSGVSRFQLLRGFLREVGATPHAYLVQLRLGLVRRHLAQRLPPADAALLAGFADQSHMTRAFVRQFGITPGRYRAALA